MLQKYAYKSGIGVPGDKDQTFVAKINCELLHISWMSGEKLGFANVSDGFLSVNFAPDETPVAFAVV
ncbi:MAG: hypothetical protein MUC87_18740 [Bacteroidia bacterium]|jgi:hypothetical protein|nr:hypothetical protein [Bacteroidia bacterium]